MPLSSRLLIRVLCDVFNSVMFPNIKVNWKYCTYVMRRAQFFDTVLSFAMVVVELGIFQGDMSLSQIKLFGKILTECTVHLALVRKNFWLKVPCIHMFQV